MLLANSGTLDADGALEAALVLACRFDSELHMAIVEELPRFPISIGEVDHERDVNRQRTTYIISLVNVRAAEAGLIFEPHIVVGTHVFRRHRSLSKHRCTEQCIHQCALSTLELAEYR